MASPAEPDAPGGRLLSGSHLCDGCTRSRRDKFGGNSAGVWRRDLRNFRHIRRTESICHIVSHQQTVGFTALLCGSADLCIERAGSLETGNADPKP